MSCSFSVWFIVGMGVAGRCPGRRKTSQKLHKITPIPPFLFPPGNLEMNRFVLYGLNSSKGGVLCTARFERASKAGALPPKAAPDVRSVPCCLSLPGAEPPRLQIVADSVKGAPAGRNVPDPFQQWSSLSAPVKSGT